MLLLLDAAVEVEGAASELDKSRGWIAVGALDKIPQIGTTVCFVLCYMVN